MTFVHLVREWVTDRAGDTDPQSWCAAVDVFDGNSTSEIDLCTCLRCLEEIRDFAKLAHRRWVEVVRSDAGRAQIDAADVALLHPSID